MAFLSGLLTITKETETDENTETLIDRFKSLFKDLEDEDDSELTVSIIVDKKIKDVSTVIVQSVKPLLEEKFTKLVNEMKGKGLSMKQIEQEFNKMNLDELKGFINAEIMAEDSHSVVTEEKPVVTATSTTKVVPDAEKATRTVVTEDGMKIPPIGNGRTWNPGDQHERHA